MHCMRSEDNDNAKDMDVQGQMLSCRQENNRQAKTLVQGLARQRFDQQELESTSRCQNGRAHERVAGCAPAR